MAGYTSPITGGSTTTPATTPAQTGAPTAVGPTGSSSTIGTPPGPGAAGLNPTPAGSQETALDPQLGGQLLPGGNAKYGQTTGRPAQQLDEKTIVQEIATHENIKATKGQSLEQAVVTMLAKKYGVKIQTTFKGTGNKQGAVGGLRHDIASWFEDAHRDVAKAAGTVGGLQNEFAAGVGSTPQNDTGQNPQPVATPSALHAMLTAVAAKVSGGDPKHPLNTVAGAEGQPSTTGAIAPSGGAPQTVADAYTNFVKILNDPKGTVSLANGQTETAANYIKNMEAGFQAAGLLDSQQTSYTPQEVAGAYQQVLSTRVSQKLPSDAAALTKLASSTVVGNPPTSEIEAFTAGIASEFGVFLTPQQITEISNQFAPQASRAGGPQGVEDSIKQAVVQLYDPNNSNDPAGVANQMFTGIQQAALDYGIPITPQQISGYVKNYLNGATVESMYVAKQSAIDAATMTFQQQAAGAYPSIAPQIQAGMKVSDIVAPYNSITAQYTGKDPAALKVDPTSPDFKFLQGGADPKTGTPTMMTMDQWKKTLMQDPQYGFQNTQGAQDMASQLSSAILNEFGRVTTQGSGNAPLASSLGSSFGPGSANT